MYCSVGPGEIRERRWPALETVHIGETVHKCRAGAYEDVDVMAFLEGLGWEVVGNDDLKDERSQV